MGFDKAEGLSFLQQEKLDNFKLKSTTTTISLIPEVYSTQLCCNVFKTSLRTILVFKHSQMHQRMMTQSQTWLMMINPDPGGRDP